MRERNIEFLILRKAYFFELVGYIMTERVNENAFFREALPKHAWDRVKIKQSGYSLVFTLLACRYRVIAERRNGNSLTSPQSVFYSLDRYVHASVKHGYHFKMSVAVIFPKKSVFNEIFLVFKLKFVGYKLKLQRYHLPYIYFTSYLQEKQ